jgi:hypothetical protein
MKKTEGKKDGKEKERRNNGSKERKYEKMEVYVFGT